MREETISGERQLMDPRLALVLSLAAIVAVFAATSWWRLLLLLVAAIGLVLQMELLRLFLQRLSWLRWFFLAVILLHALLSPGHTLFGLSWVTRDGLLHGLMVSVQVAAALAVSLALTRSAPPAQLAAAAAALMRPLGVFGLNTDRFAGQALLTLQFVPILQTECAAVAGEVAGAGRPAGIAGRLESLQQLVVTLIGRLVEKADRMAVAAAADNAARDSMEPLPPLLPLSPAGWGSVAAAAVLALCYFRVP